MSFQNRTVVLFICFFLFFSYGLVFSAIYTYVDENGVIHFTNVKPIMKPYKVLIPEREYGSKKEKIRDGKKYEPIIHFYSKKYDVDPHLIKAVILAESNFNPYAVSRKGALGLMQLMPETARMLNLKNVFDPEENIRGGTLYLRMLKDYFNDNLDLVLAAYNAGPKRVIESGRNVPKIEETIQYIKKVKRHYFSLKSVNEIER